MSDLTQRLERAADGAVRVDRRALCAQAYAEITRLRALLAEAAKVLEPFEREAAVCEDDKAVNDPDRIAEFSTADLFALRALASRLRKETGS